MAKPRTVDAKGLLYHFLQKDLQQQDVWLFQMLTTRLITSLGIWRRPCPPQAGEPASAGKHDPDWLSFQSRGAPPSRLDCRRGRASARRPPAALHRRRGTVPVSPPSLDCS